jgi:hypothetical protein
VGSRLYLILVAAADALAGCIAAAVPGSISDTSRQHNRVLILSLIGLGPVACRDRLMPGHRRNRIGTGFDEPGVVMRAGMVVVVACALLTGFTTSALTIYVLLKLVATGTPFAVLLSMVVRSWRGRCCVSLKATDAASGTWWRLAASARHNSSVSEFGKSQTPA